MKERYYITLFDKIGRIFKHEVAESLTSCIDFLDMFISPEELKLECMEHDDITTLLYYNNEYYTVTIHVVRLN